MWRRAMVIGLSVVACGGDAEKVDEVAPGAAGTASGAGTGGGAGKGHAGKAGAGAAGAAGAAGEAAGAAGTPAEPVPFDFSYDLTAPGGLSHGLWHLALMDEESGARVSEWFAYGDTLRITGEAYKVLLPGHSYRFAYFVDQELDLVCSAPPDLAEQLIFEHIEGEIDLQMAAGEGDPGSCDDHVPSTTEFHLFVNVDGFTKEETKHRLKYNLAGGKHSGDSFVDKMTLFLAQALEKDTPYKFQMFVDMDDDGVCNPAIDHVWQLAVPPTGAPLFLDFNATSTQNPAGCFDPPG